MYECSRGQVSRRRYSIIPLAKYFDAIGRDRLTVDGLPDPEFPDGMPDIYATIGEVVSGKKIGRSNDRERIVAIPIGMSICDWPRRFIRNTYRRAGMRLVQPISQKALRR